MASLNLTNPLHTQTLLNIPEVLGRELGGKLVKEELIYVQINICNLTERESFPLKFKSPLCWKFVRAFSKCLNINCLTGFPSIHSRQPDRLNIRDNT